MVGREGLAQLDAQRLGQLSDAVLQLTQGADRAEAGLLAATQVGHVRPVQEADPPSAVTGSDGAEEIGHRLNVSHSAVELVSQKHLRPASGGSVLHAEPERAGALLVPDSHELAPSGALGEPRSFVRNVDCFWSERGRGVEGADLVRDKKDLCRLLGLEHATVVLGGDSEHPRTTLTLAEDSDTFGAGAGHARGQLADALDAGTVGALAPHPAVAALTTHADAGIAAVPDHAGGVSAFACQIAGCAVLVAYDAIHPPPEEAGGRTAAHAKSTRVDVSLSVAVPRCAMHISNQSVEAATDHTVALWNRADRPARRKFHGSGCMDGIDAIRILGQDLVTLDGDVEDKVCLIAIWIAIYGDQQAAFLALIRASDFEIFTGLCGACHRGTPSVMNG